jgi:hypothetical protein
VTGELAEMESLGDTAPVSAINGGRFLESTNRRRKVVRLQDGGLDQLINLGEGASLRKYLAADEARWLLLPDTWLTWRFLKVNGISTWTLVLVDEQGTVIWVYGQGFCPEGYEPTDAPAPDSDDDDDFDEPWMNEGLRMDGVYCVTVIQDVTPDEALRRLGARDDEISTSTWPELLERASYEEADFYANIVVAAFALGPHTMLVEDNGWEGVNRPDLSAGTFAVSAYCNINAFTSFVVSRDGVVLASLEELAVSSASGADPGVLTEALLEMGIHDPDAFDEDEENFLNDLELLRRLTGVTPTVADVTGSARVAIIAKQKR